MSDESGDWGSRQTLGDVVLAIEQAQRETVEAVEGVEREVNEVVKAIASVKEMLQVVGFTVMGCAVVLVLMLMHASCK